MPTPDIPKIDGLDREQVLSLVYCKGYQQYLSMSKGYREGKCAFCDPLDTVKNKVIKQNGLWRMWVNPFGEKHTKLHLVLASIRHVAAGTEEPVVTALDFAAMGELWAWAVKEFGLAGGGFVMRFGTPSQNAGTVLHAHANIIVPDGTDEIRIPFAKKPEDVEAGIKRLYVYQKLERAQAEGRGPGITEEEVKLVEGRL